MLGRQQVRNYGDKSFLREPVGNRRLPVSEAEDLVNHDHCRRLGLSLGIRHVGADVLVALLDGDPLPMGRDRIQRLPRGGIELPPRGGSSDQSD
jgi:hypothetical protein